jgi:hypothetical protein
MKPAGSAAFLIVTGLIAWSLSASEALAYIPPSQFIVKAIAGKHAGIKGLRISGTVTGLNGDKPTETRFKEITVYDPQKQMLRSWALDDSDRRLYGVERGSESFNVVTSLLLDADVTAVTAGLKNYGVPIRTESELLALNDEESRRKAETASLARWNGGVAWVIGNTGNANSQLWVEKDSFLPLRLIVSASADRPQFDIRFSGHRFFREFTYPRSVTSVGKDGALSFREELIELLVNPKLDAEFKNHFESGFTDAGNAAPLALKELIGRYFQIIR